MDRRQFFSIAALLAMPAAAGCAAGPDPAEAWRDPGAGEADVRRFALAHAILAPNPHNRQPWLVRLDGDHGMTLRIDRSRLLPATDPYSRQIVVGCGAFLELLSLAAAARGHVAEIEAFPEGQPEDRLDDRPFALVTLKPGGAKDPLFEQIVHRRTNRTRYEDRIVEASTLDVLKKAAGPAVRAVAYNHDLGALRALANRAYRREVLAPAAWQESIDLMRIGRDEMAAHRDGLSLSGPGVEAMKAVGLLTRETLAKPGSTAHDQSLAFADPQTASAQGFLWLITPGNTRLDQIAAGRAYARVALTATALGVAHHPMSQALQEFPEMADLKTLMDRLTAVGPGERLQMFIRLGYAKSPDPAPRRGLAAHLGAA